jgi:hypothetical protein
VSQCAVEQIGHGRQVDMRMRPHVDPIRASCAGPIWSKNRKGRPSSAPLGSVRCTLNPPRSWVEVAACAAEIVKHGSPPWRRRY